MTFYALKEYFRSRPTVFQSEVLIQSIEIVIAKHGSEAKNHPHAIYCKNELIKLKKLEDEKSINIIV